MKINVLGIAILPAALSASAAAPVAQPEPSSTGVPLLFQCPEVTLPAYIKQALLFPKLLFIRLNK